MLMVTTDDARCVSDVILAAATAVTARSRAPEQLQQQLDVAASTHV